MNILTKLFSLFSYRQRFLTPAVAYILCTPYPVYVVIETSNFWIRQYEWQETGDRIQKEINGLLSRVALVSEGNNENIDRVGLNKDIEEHFTDLIPFNQKGEPTVYLLADGFSKLKDPSINTLPIYDKWKQFLAVEEGIPLEIRGEDLQKISLLIREELLNLGYSYALFQGNEPTTSSYASLVLEKLPKLLEMSRQLQMKSALQNESDSHANQIIALYKEVKKGQLDIERSFNRFYEAFREAETYTIKELDQVKKSFQEFSATVLAYIEKVSEGQSSSTKIPHDYRSIIQTKDKLIEQMYLLQHPVLQRELQQQTLFYYAFLSQFFFLLLVVWFLVRHRGLSIHLTALCDHINQLAKGQLSYCFTTHEKDEFGVIGKALDKVVDVIGIIVSDLISFSKQIEEITVRVSWAVREQEGTLLEQEKIIAEGKKSAQEISERAQFLSNLLAEICESSQLSVQAEQAHNDLQKMRNNMDFLVKASGEFLENFDSFADKVQNTQKKVNFMDRLGDQAKMLSLNGKIENANIIKSAGNFSEITNKIERFSDNSEEATSKIKKIIKESLEGVRAVKGEAQRCLSEIGAGVGQLSLVSRQLEEIAKLGEDQQKKFLKVDELMKVQANSSQKIIENVQNLLTPANENALLVHKIPNILGEIVAQQKRLTEVVEKVRVVNEVQ